jgi:hypothetical protein
MIGIRRRSARSSGITREGKECEGSCSMFFGSRSAFGKSPSICLGSQGNPDLPGIIVQKCRCMIMMSPIRINVAREVYLT